MGFDAIIVVGMIGIGEVSTRAQGKAKATELQNRPVQDQRVSVHDRCVLTLRSKNR